jgi:hypothetical protein
MTPREGISARNMPAGTGDRSVAAARRTARSELDGWISWLNERQAAHDEVVARLGVEEPERDAIQAD